MFPSIFQFVDGGILCVLDFDKGSSYAYIRIQSENIFEHTMKYFLQSISFCDQDKVIYNFSYTWGRGIRV